MPAVLSFSRPCFLAAMICALPMGGVLANPALELCSGGYSIATSEGEQIRHMVNPQANLTFWLNHPDPLAAGRVSYRIDNFVASQGELDAPTRKPGVIAFTCRMDDRQSFAGTEVVTFHEVPAGQDAATFDGFLDDAEVGEGQYLALRIISVPEHFEALANLRALVRAGAGDAVPPGPLLEERDHDGAPLNFGLVFTMTHNADPSPESAPATTAATETGQTVGSVDTAETIGDPAQTSASGPPVAPQAAEVSSLDSSSGEEKLVDLIGADPMDDHPQLQPLAGTVLSEVAFGPMQPSPGGYFSAPTVAPVGSLVPVYITYDDRATFDNIILVRPDVPDDALRGPSGRNMFRIFDEDRVYRRAGDTPGIYELRLRRQEASDYRIIARQQIELVDIDIDLQVPDAVAPRQGFEVYMNPVMDGHLVIRHTHRADDDLVNRGARHRNAIDATEGPGVFTRTAPRNTGEYEVRFHFNPPQRFRDQRNLHGRLMARTTLNVVSRDEIEDPAPAEVAEDLAGIEAQIAELSESIEQVTLAQTLELREAIAALGLPALALLTELLSREAVAPQLAFALTTPLAPAQWPGAATGPAQSAAQWQQAASSVSVPATAAPATAAPTGAAPVAQAPAPLMQTDLPQIATASYRVTGVAADDVLNVRSGPGVENTIVGMLPPNASGITPTGQSAQAADGGTWWQIANPVLPGGTGWVNAQFLAADAAPVPSTPAAVGQLRVIGIAPNEVLYLRAAPSVEAPIVGLLQPDAVGVTPSGNTQMAAGIEWIEVLDPTIPPDGVAWADGANLMFEADTPNVLEVARSFTDAPGMTDFDTFKLEQSIANILHYAQDSAFAPGHGLSPLTKAVVAAQAIDGRLPHVRYHMTLSQIETGGVSDIGGNEWIEVVELRRFNLGPAHHAQQVAAHGADKTADPEAFGEGPDVIWRFAMRPLRGISADILSASRAVIDAPQRDCMGFHCQIAQSIIPHIADWSDMQPVDSPQNFRPSYDELWRGAPSAPAMLDMLALMTPFMADATGHDAQWQRFEPRWNRDPEDPVAQVIIEIGLGQDTGGEVMLFETDALDDEIRSVWIRLAAIGGPDDTLFFRAGATERWPDRQ